MSSPMDELRRQLQEQVDKITGEPGRVRVAIPDPEPDEPCIGTCGRCGAYWDTRYYETCPPPCGGYVG